MSHSTQTIRLVVPAVQYRLMEAPPTSVPAADQRTPEAQAWHRLPPSYSNAVTPVQPGTSLVYLLCSPSGSAAATAEGSAPKRSRRRRRPVDHQGLKVKYKKLPVRFYEPGTNRILKKPPKRAMWYGGSASLGPPPPCVRQLFRSLSPDLNSDQPREEGLTGDTRDSVRTNRKGGRTRRAPPTSPHSRSKQESVGRPRPPPPTSNRRTVVQAPPLQPRRKSLRRTAPVRKLRPRPPGVSQPERARR